MVVKLALPRPITPVEVSIVREFWRPAQLILSNVGAIATEIGVIGELVSKERHAPQCPYPENHQTT